MLKQTASAPSRRECLLLALLLIALLSLSRAGIGIQDSDASRLFPETESAPQDVQVPTTELERWRTRVTWTHKQVPLTTVVSHVPGWTIFDNLFLLNGTVFVVSDDPESVPERDTITSTGMEVQNGAEAVAARLPTDRELRVVTTDEAQELFGTSALLIDGTTWILNDPPQFLAHYYHWSAELFLGFWRTYSSLDPFISANGLSSLPAPRRIWFVHTDADHWKDYASMNQWVFRSVFPSITAEYSADWQDRAEMGHPLILDRVIFTDRSAAMKGQEFFRTGRIASEPFTLPGSVHWWNLIRGAVSKFSGLDTNLYQGSKPVITYISRQEWRGRRKLIQEDHENLVKELYKLRDQHGVEVNVVSMDKLSHAEQFRLAARTTIMMGVHGNGLTSLVWMKPSPKSTVIEFFYPEGFARDYEYTSRMLGMAHYGVWNNETFTQPQLPRVNYPKGFQGNSIPLNGSVVAKLCIERLQLPASTEN
ncbi:hypothetical protein L210DRAFT_3388753 [Boletus edulis BED1]|uniref:Glycosyltransferase 61 catalytic domain-containing protein n=1 Tax=Boletus edulis BED1 TaxID=1328754 RepID=A0AAD4C3Z8_BOLED|nr:hypothetical protein L210DRAFT_3388753 [Boletus edulis BED1]